MVSRLITEMTEEGLLQGQGKQGILLRALAGESVIPGISRKS
jgi:hypothetical protein